MKIYFSDFFNVNEEDIESYGAFNISLINDFPLFIDPFLLASSENQKYKEIHSGIIEYLKFLSVKAKNGGINNAQIKSWYIFPEVKENWFGYSKIGNSGRGLNMQFGRAFSSSINIIFDDLGREQITQTSHIEKACLFQLGIGRDNISDFTTNLIKYYLCEYTEVFANQFIDKSRLKKVRVKNAYFDYEFERWMPREYMLPFIFDDYVLLTPKDILTKDDNWINANDLRGNFDGILNSIDNDQLKREVFSYYLKNLPAPEPNKNHTKKEITYAVQETIKRFPEIVKYYVKLKEENKIGAKNLSKQKVKEVEEIFIQHLKEFVEVVLKETEFYAKPPIDSFDESLARVHFLKKVIEENDGYRMFYVDGLPVKREADLQVIFRLTWFASDFDVNREVNNGRGPVDYAVSKGAVNKTLVEFKLASNSKLRQNLEKQVEVYEMANSTKKSIKVILYFDSVEYEKTMKILKELKLDKSPQIVLIDACKKISASNVK